MIRPPAPALLWLFGEQGVPALYRSHEIADDDREQWERFKKLFPEATVVYVLEYEDASP
jgi:hypothetical protein